jgi:dTMP kinase
LGLGVESVLEMGAFATEGLEPDLYIVVDVPYEVAITRRGKQQDDIEKRDREFFERVRGAYRELVAGHPSTSVLLDGTFPLDVVFERAWHEVMGVLEPR